MRIPYFSPSPILRRLTRSPYLLTFVQFISFRCDKVIPPTSYSGTKSLQNSYAVIYPTGLYSINARLNADGAVLFGGSAPNQQRLLDYVAEDLKNRQTDDSLTNFEPVTEAVRKLGREGFEW